MKMQAKGIAATHTAAECVALARHAQRPGTADYIARLFSDFFPLCGDRHQGEDESILAGLAFYKGIPVTVIGHRKGKTLEENLRANFGMPNPEGYRKAQRLMEQAEKFGRPVITFIDTPGAYPGLEAEARGQGEAIACCLALMSRLTVPTISVVIGEGGSGGALALCVSDRILMLENAVFSVLSPEGFATILWKDATRAHEAAEKMGLTAQNLLALGIIDAIVPEPLEGAHANPDAVFAALDTLLYQELSVLRSQSGAARQKICYKKLRAIGNRKESL